MDVGELLDRTTPPSTERIQISFTVSAPTKGRFDDLIKRFGANRGEFLALAFEGIVDDMERQLKTRKAASEMTA